MPQRYFDPGRTDESHKEVVATGELHLQWTRQLTELNAAFRNRRLQFDRGYEPVVLGKQMFVGSSRDDSVIAPHPPPTGAQGAVGGGAEKQFPRSLSDLPDPAIIVLEFAQIHPPLWRIFQYTPASDGGL
ncbi:MAG: hypothetical protein ACI8XO_004159 [Verrucomicrobiales bacterium]